MVRDYLEWYGSLENEGPDIKAPVIMSSFRRLRAFASPARERERERVEREKGRKTIFARINLEVTAPMWKHTAECW